MTFAEVQRYPRDWGVMGKFNSPEEKQEEATKRAQEAPKHFESQKK